MKDCKWCGGLIYGEHYITLESLIYHEACFADWEQWFRDNSALRKFDMRSVRYGR